MISMKSYKSLLALVGVVLGFGAPVGSILFRGLMVGRHSHWLANEIHVHSFYYLYMSLATPLIFAAFGLSLGYLIDRFFSQKEYLEELNNQLKAQSMMDDLTGQYNRRHILIEIEKEIERARRYNHTLAGLMIDVDDFKKFNDRFGHLVGDYVLREASAVFLQSIRKIDVIGRYGGDEFLIILPESSQETATTVAHRIQKNIAKHEFLYHKKALKVSVSIGLFFFEDLKEMDVTGFIEKIDKALRRAKTLGKNRVFSVMDKDKE